MQLLLPLDAGGILPRHALPFFYFQPCVAISQVAGRWVRTMEGLGERFQKPKSATGTLTTKATRVRALADLVHYTQAVHFVSFAGMLFGRYMWLPSLPWWSIPSRW